MLLSTSSTEVSAPIRLQLHVQHTDLELPAFWFRAIGREIPLFFAAQFMRLTAKPAPLLLCSEASPSSVLL